MTNSPLEKRTEEVKDRVEVRSVAYALAAAASGVAVLALVQPSEAEVVYTPANQNVFANGGVLDVNNDGIVDFRFETMRSSTHSTCAIVDIYNLKITGAQAGNSVRGVFSGFSGAGFSALPDSILVGSNPQKFGRGPGLLAGWDDLRRICSTTRQNEYISFGPFANKTSRYLGLKFSIDGQIHYGWARLNVTVDAMARQISAILTGYAYETTPNAPIFTGYEFGNEMQQDKPKPTDQSRDKPTATPVSAATLGRLAQGAQGLEVWRTQKSSEPK